MPQGPIAVSNVNLAAQGAKNLSNISAATVVKATPGTLLTVQVITAGSAPGTINDVPTTGGAVAANQIGTIPNQVGVTQYGVPFLTGLVIVPGSGQVVSVSFV
jgi:hypothetical protein